MPARDASGSFLTTTFSPVIPPLPYTISKENAASLRKAVLLETGKNLPLSTVPKQASIDIFHILEACQGRYGKGVHLVYDTLKKEYSLERWYGIGNGTLWFPVKELSPEAKTLREPFKQVLRSFITIMQDMGFDNAITTDEFEWNLDYIDERFADESSSDEERSMYLFWLIDKYKQYLKSYNGGSKDLNRPDTPDDEISQAMAILNRDETTTFRKAAASIRAFTPENDAEALMKKLMLEGLRWHKKRMNIHRLIWKKTQKECFPDGDKEKWQNECYENGIDIAVPQNAIGFSYENNALEREIISLKEENYNYGERFVVEDEYGLLIDGSGGKALSPKDAFYDWTVRLNIAWNKYVSPSPDSETQIFQS